jgi:hypothetical protein
MFPIIVLAVGVLLVSFFRWRGYEAERQAQDTLQAICSALRSGDIQAAVKQIPPEAQEQFSLWFQDKPRACLVEEGEGVVTGSDRRARHTIDVEFSGGVRRRVKFLYGGIPFSSHSSVIEDVSIHGE